MNGAKRRRMAEGTGLRRLRRLAPSYRGGLKRRKQTAQLAPLVLAAQNGATAHSGLGRGEAICTRTLWRAIKLRVILLLELVSPFRVIRLLCAFPLDLRTRGWGKLCAPEPQQGKLP